MKKLFLCLVSCALFSFILLGQKGAKNFLDRPYIEVPAKAMLEVVPDEIHVEITLDEKDIKGKETLAELEKKMYKVLTEIGIEIEDQLSIKDFSGNLSKHLLQKKQVQTRKQFVLVLDNTSHLVQLYNEFDKLMISQINIVKTDHSSLDSLKLDLYKKAMTAARKKADNLLSSSDQKVGNILHVKEVPIHSNRNYRANQYEGYLQMNAMYEVSPNKKMPEIKFQTINLEVMINVNFEIN